MIQLLTEMLSLLRAQAREDKPERPVREDPEVRQLRWTEQPGIDMNDLRRRADAERKSRRLPRSAAEARGEPRSYWS